jgi:ferredoxin
MIEVYCATCDVTVDVDGYVYRDEDGDPALEVIDGGIHHKHDLAIQAPRDPWAEARRRAARGHR